MSARVAIVVLNWNNGPDTVACLESLFQLDYSSYSVLVVDNGSTDDSALQIKSRFPGVGLLQTGANLGYAGGNNAGIRQVLKQQPDYVCVLNNDTVVAPSCLQALVSEAASSDDIGMVGPKIYFHEPSDMVAAAGSVIDWKLGRVVHRGVYQRESEDGPCFAHGPEDVDCVIGCCVLVKQRLIKQIGMFDTRFYLNYEDVDWCVRAWKAGYRVRYTPAAVMWHKTSASLGVASPRNTYYMTRNALLFFWIHLGGWRRWRAVGHVVNRNLRHTAVWTLKREYRRAGRARRDAYVLAMRDALLGRFGKMSADVDKICQKG